MHSHNWCDWCDCKYYQLDGSAQDVRFSTNLILFLNVCFFLRPRDNIYNLLLFCLSFSDLLFVIFNMIVIPVSFGYINTILHSILPIAECFSHISLTCSIFFTISISIERFQVSTVMDKYKKNSQFIE